MPTRSLVALVAALAALSVGLFLLRARSPVEVPASSIRVPHETGRGDRTAVEVVAAPSDESAAATRRADAAPLGSTPEAAPEAPALGALALRVIAPPQTSVAGLRVMVHGAGARRESTLDDEGVVIHEGLAPGTYQVVILDGQTWPDGMLDPYVGCDGESSWRREVEVLAGETAEVEIALPETARVYGTVVRADGTPFEGAGVQVRSMVAGVGQAFGGQCDRNGRYSFVACPGLYGLYVFWKSELGRDADVHPPRMRIELAPGDVQQHDVVIGPQGPCSASGTFVDQDGQPCADLEVSCTYRPPHAALRPGEPPYTSIDRASQAYTDVDGRFLLRGLAPGTYSVSVKADAIGSTAPPSTSQVRRHAGLIPLVLTEVEPARDLGRIAVETSRPYAVTVRLRIDEAWLAETREGMEALRIELRDGERPVEGPETSRVRRDGDLVTWWCETPRAPVELVVSDRAGRRRSLLLDPDTVRSEERELAFP